MIIDIQQSIPCVVEELPETNIETKWWNDEVLSYRKALHQFAFNAREVACNNYASNLSIFSGVHLREQFADGIFCKYQSWEPK